MPKLKNLKSISNEFTVLFIKSRYEFIDNKLRNPPNI